MTGSDLSYPRQNDWYFGATASPRPSAAMLPPVTLRLGKTANREATSSAVSLGGSPGSGSGRGRVCGAQYLAQVR